MDKLEHTEQFLEESIRQGRWSDTNKLPPERELADMLGISRGTLRLALRALVSRGFLDTRRGSGSVIKPSGDGQPDRLQAFSFFFPYFVEEYAKHGLTDRRLMEFYSLLSQFGAALKNWDKKRFMVSQPKFFALLIKMSPDAVIQSSMRGSLPDMAFWMNIQKKVSPPQCKMLFLTECDIVDAIRESDGSNAGVSMRRFADLLIRLDSGGPENDVRPEPERGKGGMKSIARREKKGRKAWFSGNARGKRKVRGLVVQCGAFNTAAQLFFRRLGHGGCYGVGGDAVKLLSSFIFLFNILI